MPRRASSNFPPGFMEKQSSIAGQKVKHPSENAAQLLETCPAHPPLTMSKLKPGVTSPGR